MKKLTNAFKYNLFSKESLIYFQNYSGNSSKGCLSKMFTQLHILPALLHLKRLQNFKKVLFYRYIFYVPVSFQLKSL